METPGENFTPEQQPILEPEKSNTKLIIVIAIIVTIVAITAGVIGWLFAKKTSTPEAKLAVPVVQTQPTADETANWKTYANTNLGFELKYPASWEIKEHFGMEDMIGEKTKVSYLVFDKIHGYANFTFGIGNRNTDYLGTPTGLGAADEQPSIGTITMTGKTIYKFFDYYNGGSNTTNIWYSDTKEHGATGSISINGKDIFIGAVLGESVDNLTTTSGKNYDKTTVPNDPDLLEIDKILSTFKFTNAAADETANWQTYTNAKYGFQFDYLTSSEFDPSKIKITESKMAMPGNNSWIQVYDLYLPTADKNYVSFPPQVTNPTPKDVAEWRDGTYLIASVLKFNKSVSDDVIIKFLSSEYVASPDKSRLMHSGVDNSAYYFQNPTDLYIGAKEITINDGTKVPIYPSDGIPMNSLNNFKAI